MPSTSAIANGSSNEQAPVTTTRTLRNGRSYDLATLNTELEALTAEQRVAWAAKEFGGSLMLSSSFGAQAAVSLHMVTQQVPDVPVVLVDTGYLFPETYRFVDELAERLKLNLKIYRNPVSPAWQEARHGQLWLQGLEGIQRYNHMNKVEPMNRALDELGTLGWISGLRRKQASSRGRLGVLDVQDGRMKIQPIVDWSDRDVHFYLKEHDLPYHPLREEGYISIGDVHTSHKITDGDDEANARFFGLTRECGLHQPEVNYEI